MKPAPATFLGSFLVALAVVAAAVGVVQISRVQLLYRATAIVHVLPGIETGMPVGTEVASVLQTEADMIRSEFILKSVIETLNLNTAWGKRYNAGQRLKTMESCEIAKKSLKVTSLPNSALLQIEITRDDADETVKVANAVAEAYCDYRVDRRQRIAENAVKSVLEPSRSAAKKLNVARQKLEAAQAALAPDIRAHPPEFPKGENPALRPVQARYNQATLQFLSRSNQVASATHSALPDTNLIASITAEFTRVRAELVAAENAVNTESQRWDALREYWVARANFENAEKFFAPFKKVADDAEAARSPSDNPPAVLKERAERAATIESHDVSRGGVMLGIAGVLLVAGLGVLLSNRAHGRNENNRPRE